MEFLNRIWNLSGRVVLIFALVQSTGCEPSDPNPGTGSDCEDVNEASVGFPELFRMYTGTPTEITVERYLTGVVASSDREGNIFGTIYIQDLAENPRSGIALKTDLVGSDALFPPGTRVRLWLPGLYLGLQDSGYALGTPREVFGNIFLDRLPALATAERLAPDCGDFEGIQPTAVRAESLDSTLVHTLVRIQDVEVDPEFKSRPFAETEEETLVPLLSCTGTRLGLVNSGYSEFRDEELPAGSGTATGILLGEAPEYRLLLRFASDLDMEAPACPDRYPPVSSDRLFISELADPDNETGARFLELYNAGDQPIDLKGWSLQRYTNSNPEPGNPFNLDGFRIEPGGTLVCTSNPETFEAVYGFSADAVLSSNGPADSNGDDNLVLIDPFGNRVDIFGVPGEDGSGTSHEFEDGGAFRRGEVFRANPEFNPGEWEIYNDSGGHGTEKRPLQAPEDFTPGSHNLNRGGKLHGDLPKDVKRRNRAVAAIWE
ncbi:extracellular nuclease [Robiginitalea biformata HTCC2501]|uniref:Extracellular nuclease n=1 Tax=Robiginitalea biformata (strain ATCC BAA-864 / DSM 15991 / KCTC 12146 / HTCC2501) TaxID=313596 RepID=A4CIP9_ROBBH|nr:extracellular nuclease [Robiginitalea biformata HTCC2501]